VSDGTFVVLLRSFCFKSPNYSSCYLAFLFCFFLCAGDSFTSLSYLFRAGRTTISDIVLEVCEAIISTIGKQYLTVYALTLFNNIVYFKHDISKNAVTTAAAAAQVLPQRTQYCCWYQQWTPQMGLYLQRMVLGQPQRLVGRPAAAHLLPARQKLYPTFAF